MNQHTRWHCLACDREWVAALPWDGTTCPSRACGSANIRRVTFMPAFPGGDYHRQEVSWEPDGHPPPPEIDPKQVHISENQTLAMLSKDEELALSSPEFE